jgi:hypothetical protein
MTGLRAAELLAGFEANQRAFEVSEIEELLAAGLVVEADPRDLATLAWLVPAVQVLAGTGIHDPEAAQTLDIKLHETEEQLKGDWYRMKTSKAKLVAQEQERILMRRALGVLRDPAQLARLVATAQQGAGLAPGAQYLPCEALGSEVYALTGRGFSVRRQLEPRLERYGAASFKAFLAACDKTLAKMQAFSGEIGTLSRSVGYVKKNPHQVVIGLAKTGVPADQAIEAYQAALRTTRAPDVAVTVARNAGALGGTDHVTARLREAQRALQRGGFPSTPVVMGLAKTLLAFDPPDAGVPRLTELVRLLASAFGAGDATYKYAARLMPAIGTPAEVVQRAVQTAELLAQMPSTVRPRHETVPPAVALAAMVRDDESVPALVARFRAIEHELVRYRVSSTDHAEGYALECIACPGTPIEVAETVRSLVAQLAKGRQAQIADVAIAVAFAKRFAY